MRKCLSVLFGILMCAGMVSGQINYDQALSGERIPADEAPTIGEPFAVQCELFEYTAPWGSVLEGDPAVIAFADVTFITEDIIELDIKLLAGDDGYAPMNSRLKTLRFTWDESIGSYISIVNDGGQELPFQAIVYDGDDVVWIVGRLEWNQAGYPWWVIGKKYIQKWLIGEQVVQPWRWSDGRRVHP